MSVVMAATIDKRHGWIRMIPVALLFSVAALPAARAATVTVTVPGTADPWLAGMPDGSMASGGDTAPAQSPTEVKGLSLTPGSALTFQVTGSVNYVPGPSGDPPDGQTTYILQHGNGAENGISDENVPVNCLVGVFLGPDSPDKTPAPGPLDFSTAESQNYTRLTPGLKQVFFIGDGLTSGGAAQQVIVPDGATRLFLGTTDGAGWYNNDGSFSVQVSDTGAITGGGTAGNTGGSTGTTGGSTGTTGGTTGGTGGSSSGYVFTAGWQGPEKGYKQGANNDWENPVNWEPEGVPGPNDTATVGAESPGDSVFIHRSVTVKNLTIGGTVNGDAANGMPTLTVTGTLNWSAVDANRASIIGLNGLQEVDLPQGSQMTIGGDGDKVLVCPLYNRGTVTWTGKGNIHPIAPFHNLGSFIASADAYYGNDGGPVLFDNSGTLIKRDSPGTTVFYGFGPSPGWWQSIFNNTGRVEVESGTLQIGEGASAGQFNVRANATLAFQGGGTQILGDGAAFIGDGSVRFGSDTQVKLDGAITFNSTLAALEVAKGGHVIADPGSKLPSAFTFNWTGGTLEGPFDLAAGSRLNISGDDDKTMVGAQITNPGSTTWTGGGALLPLGASTFTNAGTFQAMTDGRFGDDQTSAVFNNAGTFIKSGSSGTLSFYGFNPLPAGWHNAVFNNTGRIEVQSGTLQLGEGSASGQFTVGANAALDFQGGGAYTLNDGAALLGDGSVQVGQDGQVELNGTVTVNSSLAGLEVAKGGHLTGNPGSKLPSAFTLNWTGGSLEGLFDLPAGSHINISGDEPKLLLNAHLNSAGATVWSGSGPIQAIGGSTFTNAGTFQANSDASFGDDQSSSTFTNSGTFVKSGSPGATRFHSDPNINGHFINSGQVDIESGSIALFDLNNAGTFRLRKDTSADGADNVINGGTIDLQGGTMSFAGTFSQPAFPETKATVTLGGGTLTANPVIQGGTLIGPGTLNGNLTVAGVSDGSGKVTDQGTVQPGPEGTPGVLTVNGDFTQAAEGVTSLRIAGRSTAPTPQFDEIHVKGAVHLNGTLDVGLANGFTLSDADRFPVLSYTAFDGNYTAVNLPANPGLTPDYEPTATALAMKVAADTPAGTKVTVQPGDARVTYDQVTQPGTTTVAAIPGATTVTDSGVPPPPGITVPPDLPAVDVSTAAAQTGGIQVCLTVPEDLLNLAVALGLFGDLNGDGKVDITDAVLALRMLHLENGVWVDRTSIRYDFQTHQLCAATTGLSPFVVGIAAAATAPAGDVNGDGRVNVQDATLALRAAVGLLMLTPAQQSAADMNGDGKVNIQDATLVLRKAVGL